MGPKVVLENILFSERDACLDDMSRVNDDIMIEFEIFNDS